MPSECRTCLKICNNGLDIFCDNLPNKIEEFSGVEILPDYGFSSKICEECVENIQRFYNFRDQIISSNAVVDGEIKKFSINNENPLQSRCRTCSIFSENLTNLFRDGLPHKIEVTTLCQISEDERLSSNICAECEERALTLYDFRNAIISSTAIINKRLQEMQHDIDIEEMKLGDDTFQFNECVRKSGGIVTPIREENKIIAKKRIYVYKCLQCKFFTEYYRSWLKHSRSHHETTSFVCEICGKLIRKSLLSDHVKCHATKKLTCPICGQILKHEITLKIHIKRHDKAIHFECAECGKLYKTRQAYKIHLDSHEGKLKKNHKCSLCEMRFYEKSRLEKHFRSHTGERPYICKTCDKGFSSTNALKTHNRQHTQEKPYTCRYCDAAFKQAVLVRRHLKSKHPEKVVLENST